MSDCRTILLAGNGPYLNRGCEAIVRGTVNILRRALGPTKFINANFDGHNPPFIPEEKDEDVSHRPIALGKRGIAAHAIRRIAYKVNPRWTSRLSVRQIRRSVVECDAVLSIGGDNYSLDYAIPWKFMALDDLVRHLRKTLVIWGASVGPFDRIPRFARLMHAHLRDEVAAIFVREQRSQQYLATNGISRSVYVMPDPAFVMEPESVDGDRIGFEIPDGAIGLNISPLMSRYVRTTDIVRLGAETADSLRSTLKRPIILVPHVLSPHSNDLALLSHIYARLHDRSGVFLLPGTLTSSQTKGVISRLACLIAARTHATIASLSTFVPTVSLAYSVKAWGINEDLFGHTDYVIAPESFTPRDVCTITARVLKEESFIRATLQARMVSVVSAAFAAGEALKSVLEKAGVYPVEKASLVRQGGPCRV